MDEQSIASKIQSEFKEIECRVDPEHRITVFIEKDKLLEMATFLKHEIGFITPNMCTGIDYSDHIEVVWHIGQEQGPILLVLKTKTDRENSLCPSLTPTWEGFDWHERETFDLLGVKFENHPDLRRLLMPENWEGYPLREDYVYKKPKYRKLED